MCWAEVRVGACANVRARAPTAVVSLRVSAGRANLERTCSCVGRVTVQAGLPQTPRTAPSSLKTPVPWAHSA